MTIETGNVNKNLCKNQLAGRASDGLRRKPSLARFEVAHFSPGGASVNSQGRKTLEIGPTNAKAPEGRK
jgi:hypothetical protein